MLINTYALNLNLLYAKIRIKPLKIIELTNLF